MKTCREIPNLIKIGQKYRPLHVKNYVRFMLLTATYVAQSCQCLTAVRLGKK